MSDIDLKFVCEKIVDCEHKTAPTQPEGYPSIRTVNIGFGKLLLEGVNKVSEDVYQEWTKRARPQEGDLILAREAPVGNVAIIPKNLEVCLGQRTVLLRPDRSKVVPLYLMYILLSKGIQKNLKLLSGGGTVHHLNVNDIRNLKLPVLPPLAEQRKIAAILGTWDAAIATAERLVAALRTRKQALMQRLLTGEVRESWAVSKLSDIAEILVSNVDKKVQDGEPAVRLCNYMDVFYANYINNSMCFMEATASQREIVKFSLKLHDVILTKDSETVPDIAQIAVVVEELDNVVCGYHLAILRPDPTNAFGPFLRELLTVPDIHRQFEDAANGVTRFGLTLPAISGVTVPLPSITKQREIASILESCDKQIEYLRRYAQKLKVQKRGLMQRLLTGEVRVAVDAGEA